MSVYDFLSSRRIRVRSSRPKDLYVLSTSDLPTIEPTFEANTEIVKHAESFWTMSWEDRNSVLLLLMLYTLQGYSPPFPFHTSSL